MKKRTNAAYAEKVDEFNTGRPKVAGEAPNLGGVA